MRTPPKENRKSFGDYFTALMRERGFKSDEQLARRAMQVQEQLLPRVNVQRRTINNWRNDKSTPRDVSDQQFQLVAQALRLSDKEITIIEELINDDAPLHKTSHQSAQENHKINLNHAGFGGILILLFGGVLAFLLADEGQTISYTDQIPPTQLRVSESGFVLPNSDQQVISEIQLQELSGWELYVARNEIFARKGRPFVKVSSMCLQRHFDSWAKSDRTPNGWYSKKSGDIRLSDLEYRNAEIIRNYECKIRGGQYNCSGQLNQCY